MPAYYNSLIIHIKYIFRRLVHTYESFDNEKKNGSAIVIIIQYSKFDIDLKIFSIEYIRRMVSKSNVFEREDVKLIAYIEN